MTSCKSTNPEIKRLVGTDGNYGEQLGLTKDWVVRIVKLVGNYGEVIRAQRRVGLAAEDRPRAERAVEQGRNPIRAADPLIALMADRRGLKSRGVSVQDAPGRCRMSGEG